MTEYVENVRGEVGIFLSPKASIEEGSLKALEKGGETRSLWKNQEIWGKYEGNMKKYEGKMKKYEGI